MRVASIVVSLIAISVIHYAASSNEAAWHEVFQRAYYLPIVVSALWYGLRGGLRAAALAAVLFLPHVIAGRHGFPSYEFNQISEAILFFVFGALTGVLSDQQRRQSEELQKIAQRLNDANMDLQKSFQSLRRAERLSALGRLSAGLAHEIRNPLSVISGGLDIIGRPALDPEHREEFLGRIKKEVFHLNTTLTHFLEFARPRPPQFRLTDARQLMQEICGLVSEFAPPRDAKIRCILPAVECAVSVDSNQVKEVILNLVLNASDAMPLGGTIDLWTAEEEGCLVIYVKDAGMGVPEEDLQLIFDPFYTTKTEGTGLGLSIAHQIMEQHGGRIEVKRNPDQGMTFSLYFPRHQSATTKNRRGEMQ
jgi:signal transduction histidine kinase